MGIDLYWTKCSMIEPPKNRKLFIKHGDKIHCGQYLFQRDTKYYFHLDSGSDKYPRPGTHWCDVPETLLGIVPNPKPKPAQLPTTANSQVGEKAPEEVFIVPPSTEPDETAVVGYGDDGLPRNYKGEILEFDDW